MSGTCVNIWRAPTFLALDIAQQLSLKSEGVEEEEVADEGDNKQRSRFYSAEVPDLQLSKDSRESKLRRSEIISQSAKLDNLNIKKGGSWEYVC